MKHRSARCTEIAAVMIFAACLANCTKVIKKDQLSFLDAQQKPLFFKDLTKRLGDTEIGNGPFYPYKIADTDTTIRFWLTPPPEIMPTGGVVPAEVAMATEHRADQPPVIIWPAELRGAKVEAVLRSLYPKNY